jgi:hypothetical protein
MNRREFFPALAGLLCGGISPKCRYVSPSGPVLGPDGKPILSFSALLGKNQWRRHNAMIPRYPAESLAAQREKLLAATPSKAIT